jgi:hypothetical protein
LGTPVHAVELVIFGVFQALHWILTPEPDSTYSLPVPLIEELITSPDYINSSSPMQWIRQALVVSPSHVAEVASATKGQRDNVLWGAIRKFRFTASNFKDILRAVRLKRLVDVHL